MDAIIVNPAINCSGRYADSSVQVAEELNLHINTVYKIIQRGDLEVYNLSVEGGRDKYYRIRRDDLEAYLESKRVKEVQGWEK